MPRILFSHVTSRADTAQASNKQATKILALKSSVAGNQVTGNHSDTVALVKRVMRMFDLKSDACDNSFDARCNEPGVREAFAQIKREEAEQRASSRF